MGSLEVAIIGERCGKQYGELLGISCFCRIFRS